MVVGMRKMVSSLVMVVPLLLLGASSGSAQVPTDGLLLHYTFSNSLDDSSASGNNGISIGAAFGTDRFGNPNSALAVTGDTGVVSQSNVGISGNTSRTISLWLKPLVDPTNWPEGALVGWGKAGWDVGVARLSAIAYVPSSAASGGTGLQFNGWYADANVRTDPWSFAGSWHNLVVVYADSTPNTKIFLDGVLQTDQFNNGLDDPFAVTTLDTLDSAFRVNVEASGSGTSGINGLYDDIRVYDRAFTTAEVQTLYNTEVVPEPSTYALLLFGGAASLVAWKRRRG